MHRKRKHISCVNIPVPLVLFITFYLVVIMKYLKYEGIVHLFNVQLNSRHDIG